MHSYKTSLYKIGLSINPVKRLNELRSSNTHTIGGNDDTIRLLHSWQVDPDLTTSKKEAYRLETILHTTYRHKQVVGEWFDLDEKEVLEVYAFMNNHNRLRVG